MTHAESIVVLRDVLVMSLLALAVGLVLYAVTRRWSDVSWNVEGNVLSRPYGVVDAVMALLIFTPLFAGFFVPFEGERQPVTLEGLLMNVVFMLFICAVLLVYLQAFRQLNPAEMFGLRQMTIRRALRFAVIALVFTVIGGVVAMLALMGLNKGPLPGGASPQEAVKTFQEGGGLGFRMALAFVAVVSAPVTEELLFRGFLYGVVKRGTDRWFAAIFTAAVFAVVHLHVGTAPQLFLLGVGLAIAYELSGSLLVPIFMHAMFNGWNIAMMAYAASTT